VEWRSLNYPTSTGRRMAGSGKSVTIHCRQSVGRSALLAATLLVEAGINPDEAFRRIEAARGCPVPDTPEQRAWVERFSQYSRETQVA